MAQTVGDLEADGLVVAQRPIPTDGRRALIELTPAGRDALAADRRRRDGWLADAIERDLTARERRVLSEAAELLARIAEGREDAAEPPVQALSLAEWAVLALLCEGDAHGWMLVRVLAPDGELGLDRAPDPTNHGEP